MVIRLTEAAFVATIFIQSFRREEQEHEVFMSHIMLDWHCYHWFHAREKIFCRKNVVVVLESSIAFLPGTENTNFLIE